MPNADGYGENIWHVGLRIVTASGWFLRQGNRINRVMHSKRRPHLVVLQETLLWWLEVHYDPHSMLCRRWAGSSSTTDSSQRPEDVFIALPTVALCASRLEYIVAHGRGNNIDQPLNNLIYNPQISTATRSWNILPHRGLPEVWGYGIESSVQEISYRAIELVDESST